MSLQKKTLSQIKSALYKSFEYEFGNLTGIPISLYQGDLTKTILDVCATSMYELYLEVYNVYDGAIDFSQAVGDILDREAFVFGLTRNPAVSSQGLCTLSFNPLYTSTLTIPSGNIQLTDQSGNFYYNLDSILLNTSSPNYSAFFSSANAGSNTNILPNTITNVASVNNLIDLTVFTISVTNGSFYGGADPESDSDFRARIRSTIDSLSNGSVGYLTNYINSFQSSLNVVNGVSKTVIGSLILENFNQPFSNAYVFIGEPVNTSTDSIYFNSGVITSTILTTSAVTNISQVPIYSLSSAAFKINYLDTSTSIPIRAYDWSWNENHSYLNQTSSGGMLWQPVQQWDIMVNYATGDILANPDTSTCYTFDAFGNPIVPGIFPSGSQVILNIGYFTNIYNELQTSLNNTLMRVVGSNVLVSPIATYSPTFKMYVSMQNSYLFADYLSAITSALQVYFSSLSPSQNIYFSEVSTVIFNLVGSNVIKDIKYTDFNNIQINSFSNPYPGNYQLVYNTGIQIQSFND